MVVRSVNNWRPSVRVPPERDGGFGERLHAALEDHGVAGCGHRDARRLDCWRVYGNEVKGKNSYRQLVFYTTPEL